MNDIFTPSARIYTCLTTEFNGIINADYVLNYISKELEIKHEQTQIDNHEKSALDKIIYGYTPLWSQKINIMNNPTNVQIAVTSNEKGRSEEHTSELKSRLELVCRLLLEQ